MQQDRTFPERYENLLFRVDRVVSDHCSRRFDDIQRASVVSIEMRFGLCVKLLAELGKAVGHRATPA